jgi:MFS transporter, DHA2 family, multidrug resistance protein
MPSTEAGRREWWALAVLALPTLLLAIDSSVLYLALPRLAADLGADSVQQLWIVDIYGFLLAATLTTAGALGDRIGHRRLLLGGAAVFGMASLLAAYAPTPGLLIAARALLGVGAATLGPSTLALIAAMFRDARQRASAVAIWSTCFGAGAILGPTVGAAMLSAFWWGSVFLLALPVTALLLIAGPFLLPHACSGSVARVRVDVVSVLLSVGTVLPVVYAFKELTLARAQLVPLAVGLLGAVCGAVFVRRQRRLAQPLLDLSLLRIPSYRNTLLLSLCVGAVQGGGLLLINSYLQLAAGLTSWQAGLSLVPCAGAMIATSLSGSRLAMRIQPAYAIALGLLVSAAGYALLAFIPAEHAIPMAILSTCLVMGGVGPMVSVGYHLMLSAAPPAKAGSAAATAETGGQLGIALGVAVLGSIAAFVYRRSLVSVDAPVAHADSLHTVAAISAATFVTLAAVSFWATQQSVRTVTG